MLLWVCLQLLVGVMLICMPPLHAPDTDSSYHLAMSAVDFILPRVESVVDDADAATCQVQKFCTMVLSAMMSGMDDKDDVDDVITLEAMSSLSRILGQVTENDIQAILINITLRIRPCFEKVCHQLGVEY